MTEYARPTKLEFIPDRFKGQVIGITGVGSIDNLGYAAAERLLKEGAQTIVIYDVNEEGLRVAKKRLDSIAGSDKVMYTLMDITKLEDVQKKVAHTLRTCSRLDAIINCAGISGDTGKLIEETDPQTFAKILGELAGIAFKAGVESAIKNNGKIDFNF